MESMVNPIVLEDLDYILSSNVCFERFRNKTILITGANGLLASYIVYTFLRVNEKKNINCKVLGLVRNKEKSIKKFGELLNRSDFELVVSDVSELTNIDEKIDFIIHAASQASPIFYKVDPVGTINSNVLGTNNLLKIAKEKQVEGFLYISSGEVYGIVDTKDGDVKEEDFGYIDPTNVRSCYAESKRLGETYCVAWSAQHNIPCKIVRPFHTYGPGIKFNDGRVFADFVSNVVNGKDIVMKSDGSSRRTFCYISDAIIGFLKVLLDGEIGQAYNIANTKGDISILELAQMLCELFKEKGLKVIRLKENDNKDYMNSPIKSSKPNINKAKMIGWNPNITLQEGFYRTIISYKYTK